MNKNIFESAKFGDKFLTSDGGIAILLRTFESNGIWHYVSNGVTEYSVDDNGKVNKIYFPNGVDIVSRYKEIDNINEELIRKLEYCEPIVKKYNNEKIKEYTTIINKCRKLYNF